MAGISKRMIVDDNYFRLNVPQGMSKIGLDEWDKLEDMNALTNSYMTNGEIKKLEQAIAKLLQNPQLWVLCLRYLPIFHVSYRRNELILKGSLRLSRKQE